MIIGGFLTGAIVLAASMGSNGGNANYYEANFEIFNRKGNVISNYHVVIKQN